MTQVASSPVLTTLRPHSSTGKDSDTAILTWFGIVLLAVFAVIVALLPFDLANGPQYVPDLFGP